MNSRTNPFFGLLFSLALLCIAPFSQARDVTLHQVTDLAQLAEEARDKKLPILIMFSMDGCPYCVILRENYLLPMLRSGRYQNKVIIRMVKVDDYRTLTDFEGKRVSPEDFPTRYKAYVMPTMIFVDANGKEIAPRLVGIGTEGFFAGDIDNAIDHAYARLHTVAIK
ncbi:MAG: thioredoxin fold domain-containing protein [Gammaproteobacteria bacterium]|nr:thioredoxin fold domain-containing protein [Gammaproteobacteria bacterium]MDH5650331.1 thioredoxin fold domain-containing protein [Gammaproteobacteria bacterium]